MRRSRWYCKPAVSIPIFSRSKFAKGQGGEALNSLPQKENEHEKLSVLLTMLMTLSVTSGVMAHPEHDEAPPCILSLELVNKKDGATIYVTSRSDKVPTMEF